MSSRFYLQNSITPDVSPAYGGGWGITGSAVRRKLFTDLKSTSFSNHWNGNTSNTELSAQYISEPLSEQTISGTLKGQIRAYSPGGAVNGCKLAIYIKVVSNDGTTVRGTLLSRVETTSDVAASSTNKKFKNGATTPITLSSVNCYEGDRIVIEIGVNNSSTNGSYLDFGDNSATDLPEDESTTTQYNPWLEFSQTLDFGKVGAGSQNPFVKIDGLIISNVIGIEYERGVSKRFDRAKILISNKSGVKTGSFPTYKTVEILGNRSGVLLNGTTGYINVPDAANIDLENANNDDISVFAWVKISSAGNYSILSKTKAGISVDRGYWLEVRNGLVYAGLATSMTGNYTAVNTNNLKVNDGCWHFIGYTYVAGTFDMQVFVDGVKITDVTKTSTGYASDPGNGQPIQIGRRGGGHNDQYLKGNVHDISVWGRTLSASEVATLYSVGMSGLDLTQLRAFWYLKLNANDWGPNSYNGTANGGYTFASKSRIPLFKGRLLTSRPTEKQQLEITAEDYSAMLTDRELSKEDFVSKSINYIITDATYGIMPKYLPGITLTNVANVSLSVSKKFDRVSVLEAMTYLADIASANGYDFYVDENKDLHFFESSIQDSLISIHNASLPNLMNWEFPQDGATIYNKITVYGTTQSPYLKPVSATVNDATSQTAYGVREMPVVVDPTVLTTAEATDKANRLLTQFKNPYRVGMLTVKAGAVETLRPGQLISVDITGSGLSSATYVVMEMSVEYPKNKAKIRVNEWHINFMDIIAEMLKELRRSSLRSIDPSQATLHEEYNNHNGAVDNFTETATTGSATATTDTTNHKMDLATANAGTGGAVWRSKGTYAPSTAPIILNFIVTGIQQGTPDIGSSQDAYIGMTNTWDDVPSVLIGLRDHRASGANSQRYVTDNEVGGYSDTNLPSALTNGDQITIVVTAAQVLFIRNGVLEATHTIAIPTTAMKFGVGVYQFSTATVQEKISVDFMGFKRYR